jgi:thiazole synthase
MEKLKIADKEFKSRIFLGTGKFASSAALQSAIKASGTELVTAALKRVDPDNPSDSILSAIGTSAKIMLNTSGARDANEAIKIAKIAKAAGMNWIKLEIHPDPHYLLPDPIETLIAAEKIVNDGMIVLPYINADPVLAKRLEDVGVHAVMPLGSPIGSNQGIKTRAMIEIIIEQALVPVIVDAGLGMPSHAAEAIEMGADAVLINTAVAAASNPTLMAEAFALAVHGAELARMAKPPCVTEYSASSPLNLF